MPLRKYQQKRNFEKSPEPKGIVKHPNINIFVVQEHHARNLHWDLRLAMEGVLKSWAVPKKPPLKSNLKRLAIMVEDHPLDYADFQGKIPEGEYGAGTVKIWDDGTYTFIKNKIEKGELIIKINGKKLNGVYSLIKTNLKGSKNSWLFFKNKNQQKFLKGLHEKPKNVKLKLVNK